MKVVIWKEEHPNEDGSLSTVFIASHAEKNATATGPTAANALVQLKRWLDVAVDAKDSRVAPLEGVRYPKPALPDTFASLPLPLDPARERIVLLLNKPTITGEEQSELHALSVSFWEAEGLEAPPKPAAVPLHPDASQDVKDRFASASTFVHALVPDGWDVRFSEG